MRFRCQECGRLVREGSYKCSACGSYDIDIDVPTKPALRKTFFRGSKPVVRKKHTML